MNAMLTQKNLQNLYAFAYEVRKNVERLHDGQLQFDRFAGHR